MIYLERLRDDPLLLDALESNIAEWVNGMEEPGADLDGVSRNLLISREIELPDELRRYWAIAKRWKQLPILGESNSAHFESKPRFVSWGESPMKSETKTSTRYLSEPDKHFVMMVSGSIANCQCCGWGLSRAADEGGEWQLTDIDDKQLRERKDFDANVFLLEWALRHFTHSWYDEENPGDFEPLLEKRQVLWIREDQEYWFNPEGVFGWSYDGFRGDRSHRIAVQSWEKINDMLECELRRSLW